MTNSQAVDQAGLGGGASPGELSIFINHRPEGATGIEGQLYAQLAERFGADRVLLEHPGSLGDQADSDQSAWERWTERLVTEPAGAVFIALIGALWTQALGDLMSDPPRGRWEEVLEQLDIALRNPRVTVIPVLVGDAHWPTSAELPPALRPLPRCHGPALRRDQLSADIDTQLIPRLTELTSREPDARQVDIDHREVRHEPQAPRPPQIALPPDEAHYRAVVQGIGNLVVYLGFEANTDDHPGPWEVGSGIPPDDRDLAAYLVQRSDMNAASADLATVAQYYQAVRTAELYSSLRRSLRLTDDSRPGPVHRYLAALPQRLARSGFPQRFQMIVTPKYDAALERAFREAGEPFDVAVYVAPHEVDGYMVRGAFIHLPWTGPQSRAIDTPNTYHAFPIRAEADGPTLQRTIIVRVNGAVEDDLEQFPAKNYVITEDDYIDYLGGRSAEAVVPAQILALLMRADHLFLGYRIADWRLRVFPRLVRKGPKVAGGGSWAIERAPDVLERELWKQAVVELRQCGLAGYLQGLHEHIAANPMPPGR